MRKRHGLLVPSSIDDGDLVLAVDLETIIRYMHLIIFGWHECLFCHSERQSPHAVQQHMMGKGHCRVDLQEADSEFRDFYESIQIHEEAEESESKNEDEAELSAISSEDEGRTTQRTRRFAIQDGKLSLASGRRLAHRSAPTPKAQRHRPLAESSTNLSRQGIHSILEELKLDSASEQSPSDVASAAPPSSPSSPGIQTQALTRTERRLLTHNKSALTVALSKMSNRDRSALSHLSAAEKRATIVTQFKQQDRARVAERRYRSEYIYRSYLI